MWTSRDTGGSDAANKEQRLTAQQHCPQIHRPRLDRDQPETKAEPPGILQEVQASVPHSSLSTLQSADRLDLPLDLRYKKTRAIRRRLTKKESSAITERTHKKLVHFPARKFALKA